jgi:hypothetical protein
MNTNRSWKPLILALAMVLQSLPSFASGYGVGTKFADVIMEYVQQGKVYNLRTMRNLPYRVSNNSDLPVELSVQLEIPQKNQLKPGYESIPDPSWVQLVPNHFKLAAGETGLVDVILQVPVGAEYTGHHYQAHIICQTAEPPPGDQTALVFGVTLSSRLRFSVASPGPDEIRRLQKKGIYQKLNFTLEPELQYVPGFLEPGQTVPLVDKGIHVSIINRSEQKLPFLMKAVAPPDGMSTAVGYERGDPAWLKIEPASLTVPGESIRNAKLSLQLPNDPKLRGRRFMVVVQGGLQGREIPVEVYSRIYFNVAGETPIETQQGGSK